MTRTRRAYKENSNKKTYLQQNVLENKIKFDFSKRNVLS